jgi:hypothetical protein
MSTAYPGHSTNTIKRRIKDQVSGFSEVVNVTIPEAVEGYNTYHGPFTSQICSFWSMNDSL